MPLRKYEHMKHAEICGVQTHTHTLAYTHTQTHTYFKLDNMT